MASRQDDGVEPTKLPISPAKLFTFSFDDENPQKEPQKIIAPLDCPNTSLATFETMASTRDDGLEPAKLPTSPAKMLTFSFDDENPQKEPQKIIATLIQQLGKPNRKLTSKEYRMVSHILQTLSSIKTLTRAAEDALQIRFMMVGITGDWPRFPRPYEFPEELQNKAAAILTKLEEDLVVEEVIEDSPPPQASNALRDTSIKRAGKSPTSPFSPARQFPNVNDPTYNKYMHDIQISEGRRRSYIIGDKSKIISSEVFGHNGLSVGDWFPYRICALRDGAHGHMMGGIAGSKDVGAFSVVVSGGYAELDEDLGDVLYYSGSDSHKNVDPVNTILTHATKALRTSFNQKRPVRVLRGGGKARHCPSKGFRYDGLYYIVAEEVSKNKKGGAYMRFKMVRDAGQPEIDEHRPTQAERAFLTGSSLAFDDR